MKDYVIEKQLNVIAAHLEDYTRATEKLRADEMDITLRFCIANGEYGNGYIEALADRRRRFVAEWSDKGWRNRYLLDTLFEMACKGNAI